MGTLGAERRRRLRRFLSPRTRPRQRQILARRRPSLRLPLRRLSLSRAQSAARAPLRLLERVGARVPATHLPAHPVPAGLRLRGSRLAHDEPEEVPGRLPEFEPPSRQAAKHSGRLSETKGTARSRKFWGFHTRRRPRSIYDSARSVSRTTKLIVSYGGCRGL